MFWAFLHSPIWINPFFFLVFQSFTTYSSSLKTPFIMISTNHIINITELEQSPSVSVPHGPMCERVFACLCWSHGLRLSAAPPLCCLYLLNYYGHHERLFMGQSGSSWEGAYSAVQSLLYGHTGIPKYHHISKSSISKIGRKCDECFLMTFWVESHKFEMSRSDFTPMQKPKYLSKQTP